MWNESANEQLARIPEHQDTAGSPWQERIIHEHFYLAGFLDWYITAYAPTRGYFFGYVALSVDEENSGWRYFDRAELNSFRTIEGQRVERDSVWAARRAGQVPLIVDGRLVKAEQ